LTAGSSGPLSEAPEASWGNSKDHYGMNDGLLPTRTEKELENGGLRKRRLSGPGVNRGRKRGSRIYSSVRLVMILRTEKGGSRNSYRKEVEEGRNSRKSGGISMRNSIRRKRRKSRAYASVRGRGKLLSPRKRERHGQGGSSSLAREGPVLKS